MSLLDKASLIVTPNAYKESKLYSVVPSSGAGDMDVVRATTATRVNSAGLIEEVPRNLMPYSQTFNFATGGWVLQGGAITVANSGTDPFGNNNATLLYPSINGSIVAPNRRAQPETSPETAIYTQYVYAKASGKNFLALYQFNGSSGTAAWFNLSTGVVGTVGSGCTAFIENAGNGWFKCGFRQSVTTGQSLYMHIYPTNADNTDAVTASGTNGILIFGAQVEQGSTATEYFPTTTRLNIPRIDYTNGSCPSLLVEPQRTNLLLYSEQLDNAYWGAPSNVIPNAIISPDGTQNADNLIGLLARNVSLSNTNYTLRFYAKKNTSSTFQMRVDIGGIKRAYYNFDTQTTTNDGISSTITPISNNWFLCTFTFASSIVATGVLYPNESSSNLYMWGMQLEEGSYATSYIPTLASTITRNADVISKTGISSLIGQTEGTLFAEFNLNQSFGNDLIVASIETYYTNSIQIKYNKSNNTLGGQFFNGSSYIGILNTTAYTSGAAKVAYVYKSGAFKLFINGTLIGTSASTFSGQTFNSLGINALWNELFIDKAFIKSVQIYKTALIDSECINLTTI